MRSVLALLLMLLTLPFLLLPDLWQTLVKFAYHLLGID